MGSGSSDIDVVVFDFGDVISRTPPPEDQKAMQEVAGVAPEDLWAAYWSERRAYDRGIEAVEFWRRVARRVGAEWSSATVHELWALDVGSWIHVREDSAHLLDRLSGDGVRLALLSNAPRDIAGALRHSPVMRPFEALFFSAELGRCKPEPEIYEHVLSELGTAAERTAFVDDREENVLAAQRFGIAAHRYADHAGLESFLDDHGLLGARERA
ncbi:HAD family hydrolase [Streptomonospora litoralis]|uniref:GMP/IMP nucleotidase YrfG n=1 Tax=Streptomonospora litoralis TaxID=2498135 RepID=A0A4P6Q870_9ACTN|nr:HAD family phosphatase [Streptomonospora litoralis]QBI55234.1 GMP/IMP nucleotidase YrfG [Streptomonospora litoralis]